MKRIAFVLLLAFVGKLAPGGVLTVETPLGNESDYDTIKAIKVGDDNRHVAFLGIKGDKQYVVRDGVPGPAYEWVIPDSLAATPNLAHIAFAIQNGNDVSVLVDGKIAGHGYYGIGADLIAFSADGSRYAFRARRGTRDKGDEVVVHDGVEGKPYQASQPIPLFSPDGKHLLYVASPAPMKSCLVLDEKEGPAFDAVAPATAIFSPDSRRTAYVALSGGKYVPVIDGKPGTPYANMVMPPVFSPDSKHVAYVAGGEGQLSAVFDGQAGPPFDSFAGGAVVFSPNGKHVAYAARSGKQWQLMLDGKPQSSFETISGASLTFSNDSNRLAFVAIKSNKRVVILDGKEQPGTYDNILWSGTIFSPDSKHIAYGGVAADHIHVVLDGKEGPAYDAIGPIVFSPDSTRLAYQAISNRHEVVVVDGKESGPLENVTPLAFSPDSAHYAYADRISGAARLVVDGLASDSTYTKWVGGTAPTFDAQGGVNFLFDRDGHFLHIRAVPGASPTSVPAK